jgi:multisubunit Na+/H+ antiporter MnhC subunit
VSTETRDDDAVVTPRVDFLVLTALTVGVSLSGVLLVV